MKYGYMRVSTQDKQQFDRQEFVLKEYSLDAIYEEKISGTKRACGREEFNKMLEVVKAGDEIYFESMSRMARSMQDLIDTTNYLVQSKKVKVVFIKENLSIGGDNGLDAMGALIFNIMGAFAQFERDLIADRTRQALQAKKEQGVVLGRRKIITDEKEQKIMELHYQGKSIRAIADVVCMSKSGVQQVIKRMLGGM